MCTSEAFQPQILSFAAMYVASRQWSQYLSQRIDSKWAGSLGINSWQYSQFLDKGVAGSTP